MAKTQEFTVGLEHDELRLGPARVSFQRTLRIPETGLHPLPRAWAGSRCAESRTTPTPPRPSGWLAAG